MAALALVILFSSSCKKSSNNTPANKSGTPTGTSWSWTGTAPLSAEIDGVPYQATITGPAWGLTLPAFTASNSSDTSFDVLFSTIPTANTVYSYNGSDSSVSVNLLVQSATSTSSFIITPGGRIKVIAITDTTIEGQFYGTFSDINGSGATHTITHGYFKVPRY